MKNHEVKNRMCWASYTIPSENCSFAQVKDGRHFKCLHQQGTLNCSLPQTSCTVWSGNHRCPLGESNENE